VSEKLQIQVEEGIARVTFNRPESYNAMDSDVIDALARNFMSMAVDRAIRVVVISGKGKAFCTGADLKSVVADPAGVPATVYRLAGIFHQAIVEMRHAPKPFLAAINGIAAGAGFSLSLACDFRIMAQSAVLRQVYTSGGLCIDGGGTFTLPRLVGHARALEIAAFDRPIPAEQALQWGMVNKVVPDDQLEQAALEMARDLMSRSLHSFGQVKQLFERSFETSLEIQLEKERHGIMTCSAHNDATEGIRAFFEKRKPVFNQE